MEALAITTASSAGDGAPGTSAFRLKLWRNVNKLSGLVHVHRHNRRAAKPWFRPREEHVALAAASTNSVASVEFETE